MTRKFHGKQRKISVFVKRFEIETDNLCKLDQMVKLTRHENDNRANSQTKHPWWEHSKGYRMHSFVCNVFEITIPEVINVVCSFERALCTKSDENVTVLILITM